MAKEVEKYPSKKYQYRLFLVLLCGLAVWAYFAMKNSWVPDEAEPIKEGSQAQIQVNANAVKLKQYIVAEDQFYGEIDKAFNEPYSANMIIRASDVSFQFMRFCANKKSLFVALIPQTDLYDLVVTPKLSTCIFEGGNEQIDDKLLIELSQNPDFLKYRSNEYFSSQVDLIKKDSKITIKEYLDLHQLMRKISQGEKKAEMAALVEKL